MKLIKNIKVKTELGFEEAQIAEDAVICKEGDENISLSNKITKIKNNHISLTEGNGFSSGTDLNTITEPGNYKFTNQKFVSTLKNCPTLFPFKMVVGYNALYTDSEYLYQEIVDLRGYMYWRNHDEEKGWQEWKSFINDKHLPNISTGDLGEAAHLKNCEFFMQRMRQKAKDIKLSDNTVINTPSGLCKRPIYGSLADIKYNSYITVDDALKLLIAARHTPEVYRSMSLAETYIRYNQKSKHIVHSILGDTKDGTYPDGTKKIAWRNWAQDNGYTILAAKGGSLNGNLGENNKNGIVNMTMLLQYNEEIYAVAVLNMEYDEDGYYRKELRELISGLIEWIDTDVEPESITTASVNNIALGGAKITLSGTFDEDIQCILDSKYFKGRNSRRVSASVIKILTAITAVSYLEPAFISVTHNDLVGGSVDSELAEVGIELTMKDALSTMLMKSDNNMATMLARVCGGKMYEKENLETLISSINTRLMEAEQRLDVLEAGGRS